MIDIKTGVISAVDEENGLVRVNFPDRSNKESKFIPLLVPYSYSHSKNYMPAEGQPVYVLNFLNADGDGVVLGCPMTGQSSKSEVKTNFSDGGYYKYDTSTGELTLSPVSKLIINGDVEITGSVEAKKINVSESVTLNNIPYIHP